jgi:hypothetical protein
MADILVLGDSWTSGYNVEEHERWTSYLVNHNVTNISAPGWANRNILNEVFTEYYKKFDYDLLIIGWSGVTRQIDENNNLREFSTMNDETYNYFREKSLENIIYLWESFMQHINKICTHMPVIHFSVFGDKPLNPVDNLLEESFFEFLANADGYYFDYPIQMFEYDWLSEQNINYISAWSLNNFQSTWMKACAERETLRETSQYFLSCGHPTASGHRLWGEHINTKVNNILNGA